MTIIELSKKKLLSTLYFLGVLIFVQICISVNVYASNLTSLADVSISITNQKNEAPKSTGCRQDPKFIKVVGFYYEEIVECTYDTPNFQLSFRNSAYNFISFNGDNNYYKSWSSFSYIAFDSSAIVPGTDVSLLVNNYDQFNKKIAIYTNTSERFTKDIISSQYSWDSTNPWYELVDSQGDYIPVIKSGYSENGKWIAAEVKGGGIVLIDVYNKTSRLVSKYKGNYNSGQNPDMELRVSDNGDYIAFAGLNTNLGIISTPKSCGDPLTKESLTNEHLFNSCSEIHYDSLIEEKLEIKTRLNFTKPKFNEESNKLDFYVYLDSSQTSEPGYRKITITSSDYVAIPRSQYLALGDSYSSGEGDTDLDNDRKKFYRFNTDVDGDSQKPREKCHISTRSYPYELSIGMKLGLPLTTPQSPWQSVACSAATAWDIKSQGSQEYLGQSNRLKNYDSSNLKAQGLNEFIPGRQKQIEFVKKYRPQAITLTAGGNDIGFGEKMRDCALSLDSCSFATELGRERLARQISDQYDNLKSLYKELYEASEKTTKIYVIAYPQFINGDKNASCSDGNLFNLNGDEREMISQSIAYMNNTIEHAARASGVKFLDIEDSLKGHRLCDEGKKYVTGMTNVLGFNGNEIAESFHPNAKGHHEMAMSIWDKVNKQDLMAYSWCENNANNCPDAFAKKETIETPSYFSKKESQRNVKYKEYTPSVVTKGGSIVISVPPYTFSQDSVIRAIDVSSNQVLFEGVINNAKSEYKITKLIPVDIPAGLRTVVIEGDSYSGEPIGLEQVLTVRNSDADDIDGDGINDSNDQCIFIPVSRNDIDKDGIDDACDAYIGDPPIVGPSPSPSQTPSPSPTPNPSLPPASPIDSVFATIKKIVTTIIKIFFGLIKALRLF